MRQYFTALALYGRELTVRSAECPAGRTARGFIEPLEGLDTKKLDRPRVPGRVNDERYLLIAPPSAIVEGETGVTVSSGGRLYEVLRYEPVTLTGLITHWEGAMRLKGGSADAGDT